jgi:glycosyltransferase involved in cell wall biosynthesis
MHVFVLLQEHADRRMQGWVNHHAEALAPQLIPRHRRIAYMFRQLRLHKDATHVFGSPFEQPALILTLFMAIAMGRRVFLISEPYSPISAGYQHDKQKLIGRLKAQLRPVLYQIYGYFLRRRIAGVFAISPLAVAQYQHIGIERKKIFPFGYFVPGTVSHGARHPAASVPELRLIFVGTLIARKGLDVLIQAVDMLNRKGPSIQLDVYGPGDTSKFDFNNTTVRYRGLIPFGKAQPVIAGYDLLVLPSLYDGWGVVVNEALMAGVPVVCSDRVGAAAVVEKWQCGAVFASQDAADLASKLKKFAETPVLLDQHRRAALDAGLSLQPVVAGRYMFDVLGNNANLSTLTACPWYD